jgi:hypothetical protein
MACGFPGLSAVLGRDRTVDLECLGVKMVVHDPQQTSLPTCHSGDTVRETKNGACVKTVPESWKLTQQQQKFIELFDKDDQQKQ